MRSLIQQLENSKYSTILYVFSNNSRAEDEAQPASSDGHRLDDFFGFCDVVASQLSSLYNKNIILWPCPKMKVSVKSSGFKLNFRRVNLIPTSTGAKSIELNPTSGLRRRAREQNQINLWVIRSEITKSVSVRRTRELSLHVADSLIKRRFKATINVVFPPRRRRLRLPPYASALFSLRRARSPQTACEE